MDPTRQPAVIAVDHALRDYQGNGPDPLLDAIRAARHRWLQAEQEVRMLIAYGREFRYPHPYFLIDLADAAGLSISGVRISYDADDVRQVAEQLDRPPVTATRKRTDHRNRSHGTTRTTR
jgi:hypothetical protein